MDSVQESLMRLEQTVTALHVCPLCGGYMSDGDNGICSACQAEAEEIESEQAVGSLSFSCF
jgi:predicted amidophosphoribosyltransferase